MARRQIIKTENTTGGTEAYKRGEKPITYWSKKNILIGVQNKLAYMRKSQDYSRKYNLLLKNMNLDEQAIMEQLKKHKLERLKLALLEYSGLHLTGDFDRFLYRHTGFYAIVDYETLLSRLKHNLLVPKVYKQMRLEGI